MKINSIKLNIDNNSIILRSPELHEAEALLSYFKQLFHESSSFLNLPKDHYDNQNSDSQKKFIEQFNNSLQSFVIVAVLSDKIIGHIIIDNYAFNRSNHRAKLVMGMLECIQNKGLGSALLRYSIEHLEQANISSLELQVKSYNLKAIKLYEQFGFIRVGTIIAAAYIDGEYIDEYLYQKLSPSLKKILENNKSADEEEVMEEQSIKFAF